MSIELMITIGGTIASIGGAYAVIQWRLDRQDKDDEKLEAHMNKKIDQHIDDDTKVEEELKRNIEAVWKWKDEHERDAANMREKYQVQLSEIKGGQMVVNEQFRQIMNDLREIKERLGKIEDGK